jgi:hypothetical protein
VTQALGKKKERAMSTDPWKGHTYNFTCAKGDAIFTGILREAVSDPRIEEAMEAFRATATALDEAKDHRALAVVFALAVEGALDAAIEAFAPAFNGLHANRDLTFSLKVEFLKSLALIPPHILDAVDPVRKIRNEFGHNLLIRDFKDLPAKFTDSLAHHLERLVPDFDQSLDTQARLRELTTALVVGLLLFRHHIALLREYIESAQFRTGFSARYPAALSGHPTA